MVWECGEPWLPFEYFHMVNAREHLRKAEKMTASSFDLVAKELVNRGICAIDAETSNILFYFFIQMNPFGSLLFGTSGGSKIHNVRMDIEHAAQISEGSSGGSAAAQELYCAARDLLAYDPHRWVHPVSANQASGMLFGATAFGKPVSEAALAAICSYVGSDSDLKPEAERQSGGDPKDGDCVDGKGGRDEDDGGRYRSLIERYHSHPRYPDRAVDAFL